MWSAPSAHATEDAAQRLARYISIASFVRVAVGVLSIGRLTSTMILRSWLLAQFQADVLTCLKCDSPPPSNGGCSRRALASRNCGRSQLWQKSLAAELGAFGRYQTFRAVLIRSLTMPSRIGCTVLAH